MLFYVRNESGMNKNQIIRDINAGMKLMNHEQKIMLMRFIDVVVLNINDNTYYTIFEIQIDDNSNNKIFSKIQSFWKKKTIVIIDEINMIKLHMLNIIENECKKILNIFSINVLLFERIFVIMFMKNFYQIFFWKICLYGCLQKEMM